MKDCVAEECDDEHMEDDDDDCVVLDDVDDAMMVADMDQGSQEKQSSAKKLLVKFEKQHVKLTPRKGKRISTIAFAKGYFLIPTLTDIGKKFLEAEKGWSIYSFCCS